MKKEEEQPDAEDDPGRFFVVGIGASAGGLKAIGELLAALPREIDLAVVVVMHLDPAHPSTLAELLGSLCALPVEQATDGKVLEPGHVYVIPPDSVIALRAQKLSLIPRTESPLPQRPIDLFLHSLAQELGDRAIGVILSGAGSDGTEGLQVIEAEEGFTFAQDGSAEYPAMPSSAVAAGCVHAVLPPSEIAGELVRISGSPTLGPFEESALEVAPGSGTEDVLSGLVRKLSRMTGIDFVNYKQTTVRRRIRRRILMLSLKRQEDYVAYFDEHPEEAETLCQDILIRVTGFFRDADVFEALGTRVFPAFVKDRDPGDSIRIWMPGCATGEEVYSVAICLLEFLEARGESYPVKLFGTDVSEQAVVVARSGTYSEHTVADVSPERLRRFFVKEEHGYAVTKAVRELCIFAQQDATRDPPFSNLDLVSCRNLLIYLGPVLQKKVVPVFHYALREGGHLLLGTAESVGAMQHLFAPQDERLSLYVRKSVPRRLPVDLGAPDVGLAESLAARSASAGASAFDVQREADRVVLAKYAPAGVLVDEELQVLQFRGDTGAFLAPAPGPPNNNLLRMAREGLLPDLQAIIEEGKLRGVPVRREGLRIKADGREIRANLELSPIRIPGTVERCYAILFEEAAEGDDAGPRHGSGSEPESSSLGSDRAERLERELAATKDFLQANVERLEVANEELRAAHEEVLSSNEELQSTNEELQTAKEELQATNEELLTTNEELRHRNREVALLGSDLTNLLSSIKTPIIMLGRGLQVRRITPTSEKLLGVSGRDIGRRITELSLAVDVEELEAVVLEVLDSLTVAEQEVQDSGGRWYVLRVGPYRTEDDRVDGAVITLTDIDSLKRFGQDMQRSRDFAEAVLASVRAPLLVIDGDLSIRLGNESFCDAFDTTPEGLQGQLLRGGFLGNWVTPEMLAMLAQVRESGTPFAGLEARGEVLGRGVRSLKLDACRVPSDDDRGVLVLLAIEDVTDRELAQAEKEGLHRKLLETQRLESLGVLAGGIAHDFNNILSAILGFAELIEAELPQESSALPHAGEIARSSRRGADLCNQMLAYAGKGRFQLGPVDLTGLVERSKALLEAMVSKKTLLAYELATGLDEVEADAAQVRQVLTNLVINASEACGERGGGRVTITTGRVVAASTGFAEPVVGGVTTGEHVFLEVADDGPGMSAETRARIFDPFFTTKFTGRGLGLAAVQGIVHGHRGVLEVNSELGGGSTFRLLLPSSGHRVPETPSPPTDEDPSWTGSGTVLVVDDEPGIRSFLRVLLPRLGLKVEEVSCGEDGVDLLRARAQQIDLVLLDLTMPGLSSAETFQRLRELRPDLAVVLMSGYGDQEVMGGFPAADVAGFLRKPFGQKQLAAVLHPLRHVSFRP